MKSALHKTQKADVLNQEGTNPSQSSNEDFAYARSLIARAIALYTNHAIALHMTTAIGLNQLQ